jgi:hypothetical protein
MLLNRNQSLKKFRIAPKDSPLNQVIVPKQLSNYFKEMLQQIEVRRPNNPEGVPPNYI